MQISSSYTLPSITGYPQPGQGRQTSPPPTNPPVGGQTPASVASGQVIVAQTRERPTYQAQAMFDQSLTYRGEQARRTYQHVEMGGEVELMHRLDETC